MKEKAGLGYINNWDIIYFYQQIISTGIEFVR